MSKKLMYSDVKVQKSAFHKSKYPIDMTLLHITKY